MSRIRKKKRRNEQLIKIIIMILLVGWSIFWPTAYFVQGYQYDNLRISILENKYLPNFGKEKLVK